MVWNRLSALALCVLLCGSMAPARAQDVADFYRGKTITVTVAVGPGAYDLYARVLVQHMPAHIPGRPTMIVNNMPGAGGILAANYIGNIAPSDGTALLVPLKPIAMTQLLEPANVKYDAARFNWIGSMVDAPGLLAVWHNAPASTLEDARRQEIILGSSGAGAETTIFPSVINAVLGTRFKVVSGFKGMGDIYLAVERGEVHGVSTVYGSLAGLKPEWLSGKKVKFLAQVTMARTKELPDVPAVVEYARTDEDKAIIEFITLSNSLGRAITAPPGVPANRVAALRKAFDETVASTAYIEDARSKGMELNPISGAVLQSEVQRQVAAPKALVDKVKGVLAAAASK